MIGQAEAEIYRENGFLVVKDVLPAEDVTDCGG